MKICCCEAAGTKMCDKCNHEEKTIAEVKPLYVDETYNIEFLKTLLPMPTEDAIKELDKLKEILLKIKK